MIRELACLVLVFHAEVLCTSVPCIDRWSHIINETHPHDPASGGSDREQMDSAARDAFCPPGHVTQIRCLDEKGEDFDPKRGFPGHCSVSGGLVCSKNGSRICPDFAITYHCSCPTTTKITRTGPMTSPSTTPASKDVTSTKENNGNGNSGSKVNVPVGLLVVSVSIVSALGNIRGCVVTF